LRAATTWILIATAVAVFPAPGLSAEIVIDDPEWLILGKTEQTAIEKRLKDGGALDPEDVIIYRDSGKQNPIEKNVPLKPIIDKLGDRLCERKFLITQAACAPKASGERSACAEAAKGRYERTKSKCK
jgi:hypothetical protein